MAVGLTGLMFALSIPQEPASGLHQILVALSGWCPAQLVGP
jgi:hypothetical protein